MAWAVGVGSVFDGDDVDLVIFVVDAVDDPVIPTAGAVQAFEVELQPVRRSARFLRSGLSAAGPRSPRQPSTPSWWRRVRVRAPAGFRSATAARSAGPRPGP